MIKLIKNLFLIMFILVQFVINAQELEKTILKERYDEFGNKKIHKFYFDDKGKVYREEERTEEGKLIKIYRFLEYNESGKIKKISIDNWETGKITKLDFFYNGKQDLEKVIEKNNDGLIIRSSEFFKKDNSLIEEIKDVNGKTIKVLSYRQDSIEDISKDFYKEKEEISEYIKKIQEEKMEKIKQEEDPYFEYYQLEENMKKEKSEMIVYSNLNLKNNKIYNEETLLGQIISDAVKEYSGANIVFLNSGIIKGEIKKGEVYYNQIEELIKKNEYISYIKVKGEVINDFFNEKQFDLKGEDFLNSAGIKNNKKENRIKIEGFLLDPYKEYLLACNTYIYNGEGNYSFFKGKSKPIQETKVKIDVVLAEYLKIIEKIDQSYIFEKREE